MLLNIPELLIFLIPAYIANAFPVLLGGGLPLDFGKNFLDGKPFLGPHKTFRGLIGGLFFGWSVSGLLSSIIGWEWLILGFFASVGSLVGDLFGAFVKRRFKLKAGSPAPLLDQLDFIAGALLFTYPVIGLSLSTMLVSILLTPPIHLFTNWMAFKLGLKKVPW